MPNAGFAKACRDSVVEAILPLIEGLEFNSFGLGMRCKEEKRDELRKTLQKEVVLALQEKTGKKIVTESPDIFITIDLPRSLVMVNLMPAYVSGRYNKLERGLAQTIHYCFRCGGRGCDDCSYTGKTGMHSVQEIVSKPALKFFSASSTKLHGQGREDGDVLMLGKGRPFVLELVEPEKRNVGLKKLEKEINRDKRVKVRDFQFCEKKEIARIKELKTDKVYLAIIECEGELPEKELKKLENQTLEIIQKTPLRVVKRRADLERKRKVRLSGVKPLSKNTFSIEVRAGAGLYIKELITGDGGRTSPSISSLLGKPCKCTQLDVREICE